MLRCPIVKKTLLTGFYTQYIHPLAMKRGAVKKESSRLVNVWIPEELFPLIDLGVHIEDTDRSKFVRRAIREKLQSLGIRAEKAATE